MTCGEPVCQAEGFKTNEGLSPGYRTYRTYRTLSDGYRTAIGLLSDFAIGCYRMCYRMYRSVSECIGDGDTLCAIGLYRTIGLCIGRLSDYRTLYRMAIGLCIGQLSDRQTIGQLSDGLPTVNPTVKRNLRAHVLPLSDARLTVGQCPTVSDSPTV